jgi:phage pi2 protein 07
MKTLNTFIKQTNPLKLSKTEKAELLKLDAEFGDVICTYREDRNWKDVLNIDEEYEKFISARNRGIKYYPQLKMHPNKFSENGLLQRMEMLRNKFMNFNCFLSKYYIEILNDYIIKVKYTMKKNDGVPNTYYLDTPPSLEIYELALKTVKEHPYEVIKDGDRTLDAKYAQAELQKYIDKLGYKWEIILNDEMMPRMNVNTNKTMRIKSTAHFSEDDLDGLKMHEIEGHIGRRYYGMKTGLNLFLYGLFGRNTLDEGLAVYNSLHRVNNPKKNIHFNTALKTCVVYQLNKMDFCELFDYVKSLTDTMPDRKIFGVLIRAKREILDMRLPGGWHDDMSYFVGYQIVKDMTDKERDDILKYNIGPDQIKDLPDIKKFLKLNKFESLI